MDSVKIQSLLGRGGFAVVHKATSNIFPTPIALKRISKHRVEEERLVRLVENEVSIQNSCEHPNIVKFHDYFEDDKYINIILELCQGGDCAQLLRKEGKFPQRRVISYVKQLLHALEYLHRHNIYHRDVKLSNMFLQKASQPDQYTVKLGDFGLAKQISSENVKESEEEEQIDHTICGTKLCMAPEVIWGRPQGPPADIFSVGVVAYTMLVGKNPFQRSHVKKKKRILNEEGGVGEEQQEEEEEAFPLSSAMERIGRGSFTIPSHVTPEAADFIRNAMCVDPTQRPTAIELLHHGFLTGVGSFPARLKEEEEEEEEEQKQKVEEKKKRLEKKLVNVVPNINDAVDTVNVLVDDGGNSGVVNHYNEILPSECENTLELNENIDQSPAPLPSSRVRIFKLQEKPAADIFPFSVRPLSTKRLSPTTISVGGRRQREKNNNGNEDITENTAEDTTENTSTIEILKSNGNVVYNDLPSKLRMEISSDGMWVAVKKLDDTSYRNNTKKRSLGLQWKYPLRDLPLQHRDQYRFVAEAIGCIRSLTAKLIVRDRNEGMLCTLMEDDPLPLFDVQFQDGGCVRISTSHDIARVRVPMNKNTITGGDSTNSGQGSGRWYGVSLTTKFISNNDDDSKMISSIDVDNSWCPNPCPPPDWEETLSFLSTERLHRSSKNAAADPGGEINSTCNETSMYVWNVLSRAQQALTYCLALSRKYEAECAACTTIEGSHPAVSCLSL
jgi:serine/threonine protein kinase